MLTLHTKPVDFSKQRCEPCHKDEKALTRGEAEIWLAALTGWELDDNVQWLSKRFAFPNFVQAIQYANRVAELAEQEKHHPDLLVGWGYVTVRLQTHALCGLHRNDFILASKIDKLLPVGA